MVDTRSIRPSGLIWKLEIVVGEYAFEISTIELPLDAPGACPLLLGRPWLRTTNIKQKWQHNMISFQRGRTKVKVPTQEYISTTKEQTPLYVEEVHMLEGPEEEVDKYLEEKSHLVPLFEIDVIKAADAYVKTTKTEEEIQEMNLEAVTEVRRAQEAFEQEMDVS